MAKMRLFSRQRYERCARLFRSAKTAHVLSLAPVNLPLRLTLANGDTMKLRAGRRSRRMLKWLLESWPDPGPITVEDGLIRIQLNENSYPLRPNYGDFMVFGEIMVRDIYNLKSLNTTGTVVDLGANVGLFALQAAAKAQRVIAVEPVASNLKLAEKILDEGGVTDKVKLIKAAICGDSEGSIRIYDSADFPAGNSVFKSHTSRWRVDQHEDVPKLSLAELFEREQIERCDLLKCDIEGSEFEAIESAPRDVLKRIDRIAMEVHLSIASDSRQQFARLQSRLESANFRLTHEKVTRWWGGLRGAVTVNAVNRRAA